MKDKRKAMRTIVSGCLAWMKWGFHPEEIVAMAQTAASLFRAGTKAEINYFSTQNSTIGTDGEVCP